MPKHHPPVSHRGADQFAAWVTVEQPEMADVVDERRAYLRSQAERFGLDSATIDVRIGGAARGSWPT
ncbi:MAG: hypothetical protein R2849_10790 [Thermomicrobiales bacterium]